MKQIYLIYQKAGFCLVGFLLCVINAWGQYPVSGEILEVGYDFSSVKVELKQDGSAVKIPVSANGNFFTSLDWNKTYYFSFKKSGYVTKVIEFSTLVPNDVALSSIEPYHMPVRLFEVFEGVDTVFFNNPVAKIRYDKDEPRADGRYGDFADDRDYSLNVRYRIDQMREKGKISGNVSREKEQRKLVKVATVNKIYMADAQVSDKREDVIQVVVAEKKTNKFIREETNGTPPLKGHYPQGETLEEFDLKSRYVKRTIFVFGNQRRVFLSVLHDWGGHFFFIDEANIGYRCISKEIYEDSIVKCRTKLIVNK